MEARESNFLKFLNNTHQFVIPLYQRPYSWTIKECKQLLDDILEGRDENPYKNYFIGSIVFVQRGLAQPGFVNKYLLIDGQQRITTLSLLILALTKEMKTRNIYNFFIGDEDNKVTVEKLREYCLINPREEKSLRYKLRLSKSDNETYTSLIENIPLPEKQSKSIINCYTFFEQTIKELEDLKKIYNGISGLDIIYVALDAGKDNPQLIFESLNSTGRDLTQADLIRNYILMGLSATQQEEIYNSYWHPMERNFSSGDYYKYFDRFMRDYLTLNRKGDIPNINDVYVEFKKYVRNEYNDNITALMEDVHKFSQYYVNLVFLKEDDFDLKKKFEDILTLKVDVVYPFLLEVYNDYISTKISKDEFIDILAYIESYIFRRSICNIPTNSLNKTFANLSKEIEKEKYLESLKATLILKDSYRRFPNNEELEEALKTKDVYNFGNRNYLLRKLENYQSREIVNIEKCTIEHIMPQNKNLPLEWQNELGKDWVDVQDKYIHSIGNLTLTFYNPELSDKPFTEKRDMKGGFKESKLSLNKSISKLDHWNEETILARSKEMAKLIIKIWPYPDLDKETLDYYKKPKKTKEEQYTLDDFSFIEGDNRILYEELRKRILNLDASVREEFKKYYIAYKSITNFVDIIPQKNNLTLTLNMPFNILNDPKELCKDLSGGHLGNGEVEFKFSTLDQIDYAMFLIKQSLDLQLKNGN